MPSSKWLLASLLLASQDWFCAKISDAVDVSQMVDPRSGQEQVIYGKSRVHRRFGYKTDSIGNVYRGDADEEGRLSGWAYLLQPNVGSGGREYEGEWVNGKKEGIGVHIDVGSGLRSIGVYSNGQLHGLGAIDFVRAVSQDSWFEYHGEFKEGSQHGLGVIVLSNAMYMGTFKENSRSGIGKIVFEDESEYRGQVKDNHMEGFGRYSNKKFVFEGQFVGAAQHGFGSLEVPSTSTTYTGFWKHGQRQGCGIEASPGMIWGTTEWVGQFEDGKRAQSDSSCRGTVEAALEKTLSEVRREVQRADEIAAEAEAIAITAAEQSQTIVARVRAEEKKLEEELKIHRAIPDDDDRDPTVATMEEAERMTRRSSSTDKQADKTQPTALAAHETTQRVEVRSDGSTGSADRSS